MKTTNQTPAKVKAKGIRRGGRPPRITEEFCENVAVRMVNGMPLTFALRLENEAVSLPHFKKSLERSPLLLARFEKKCGELLEPILNELNNCDLRHMPAKIWKIQRRFAEHFADPKAQAPVSVVVNNTSLIGISDSIQRRAAEMVKRLAPAIPAQIDKE